MRTPTERVVELSRYEPGKPGWVIETIVAWRDGIVPVYVLPSWEDRGFDELSGPFETKEEAEDALARASL